MMTSLENNESAPHPSLSKAPLPVTQTFKIFKQLIHLCRKKAQLESQGKR